MNLMLKDENNNPSTSRSIFWYGCLICLVKLTLSKVIIGNYHLPEFTGGDFAASLGALGGIRALDKHITNSGKEG